MRSEQWPYLDAAGLPTAVGCGATVAGVAAGGGFGLAAWVGVGLGERCLGAVAIVLWKWEKNPLEFRRKTNYLEAVVDSRDFINFIRNCTCLQSLHCHVMLMRQIINKSTSKIRRKQKQKKKIERYANYVISVKTLDLGNRRENWWNSHLIFLFSLTWVIQGYVHVVT